MNKKGEKLGICSVCGENKNLTFEHYPPQSAYNKTPVWIKDHRHVSPMGGPLYGKAMKSNRGFGGYRLCKSCNNNTGGWYSKEYANVVSKSISSIISQRANSRVVFEIELALLNFIKQIFTIHLCADQALGALRIESRAKEFILNKESQSLSEKIKIYMYATLSTNHRFMSICTASTNNLQSFGTYSEFNFHPFGFLLALDSDPTIYDMKDITYFKVFNYNEKTHIKFNLPLMPIKNLGPANYP